MAEENHPIASVNANFSLLSIGSDDNNKNNLEDEVDSECSRAGEALSNYLVLRNIFSNLSNSDIKSCCQVNKCWHSIAVPLFVTYFDVKLTQSRHYMPPGESSQSYGITLTRRATYKSDQVKYGQLGYEEASQLLEAAVLDYGKIAIDLNVNWRHTNTDVIKFLTKFGNLVEKFCVTDLLTTRAFCEMLVRYFPNLKHLDLSGTCFDTDDQYFDKNLKNRLKDLRRIDLEWRTYDYQSLVNIFQMAPDLTEIHDFPILLVETLINTQKAGCVKSLTYPKNGVDPSFQIALEGLARLEPKLHSFSFQYLYTWAGNLFCSTVIQSSIQRILKSSHDSLKTLTLHKSESLDFKELPPMNRLKELKFSLKDKNENCVTKCIGSDVDLQTLFPNVSTVNILTLLCHYPMENITSSFPKHQFSPWGAQIEELELVNLSVNILEELSALFPSVKKLQFQIGGRSNDLRTTLPAIGQNWPELEYLTVVVAYSSCGCSSKVDDEQCTFDSVFTGIPDDVIVGLRDPLCGRNNFLPEEIEEWKQSSTIRKLSKLKILKFGLDDGMSDYKFMGKLGATTSVSKDFGFQFLPELKVVVRTYRGDQFQPLIDLKTSLEPLVKFEVEKSE